MKTILRIEKRKAFTIISRPLLEDRRLKWATRGILGYLLSKPDDWELHISDLKKNGDLGRDALYARISEAIQFGYISRFYQRDEKGRVLKVEYVVREDPVCPYPEKPEMANPVTDKPDKANTDNNKEGFVFNTEKTPTTTWHAHKNPVSLVFPEFATDEERAACALAIARLDEKHQQRVLDELAARMTSTKLGRLENPVGYLKGWLIKKIEAGELPYTDRGEKLAMLRDPQFINSQQQKICRQKRHELTAEINHLNRLIEFQQGQGFESDELKRQVTSRQIELDQLKLNLQSQKDMLKIVPNGDALKN